MTQPTFLEAAATFHPGLDSNATLAPELLAKPGAAARTKRPTVLPPEAGPAGFTERERFEPQKPLGEGGMGEVHLVRDHDIGRDVAVKRLHTRLQRGAFSRFVGEVRTIGQLEHPNIIPIHDVGKEEDGSYFFVMKYVEGETVERIIERLAAGDPEAHRIYTFERRIEIFRGVLRALQYAHRKGIIHRDIKPANVMVGPFGEVVLMDWGIARSIGGQEIPVEAEDAAEDASKKRSVRIGGTTRMGALLGTPLYMSPEQSRGEHDKLDGRSDLFSASLMFYEMLALKHPLAGLADIDAIRAEIPEVIKRFSLADTYHPAQGYAPAELLYVALKGVAADPAARFQSAEELLERLQSIQEGHIPVQCHVTFAKRMARESGRAIDRHPKLMIAGAVAAVAMLVIGAAASGAAGVGLLGAALWAFTG